MQNTVVITGGSKGIGAEIASGFSSNKWNVVIGSRNSPSIKEHEKFKYCKFNATIYDDHVNLINFAEKNYGNIKCYINCAGFSKWSSIENLDNELIDNMIDTNLKGTLWGCKAAASYLKEDSSIINISSLAGKRGSANNSIYCATKFAVNGITQSLAKELGPNGIRVNSVCPVYVETEGLLDALRHGDSPANGIEVNSYLNHFTKSQTALRRLPLGKEVADLCFYLSSDNASAITGQCINVDCGVLPQ